MARAERRAHTPGAGTDDPIHDGLAASAETSPDAADVVHDPDQHRFVLSEDDAEAELVYFRRRGELVLVHTGVPEAVAGRGVGGRLVAAAVDFAREQGLAVVALCPFARRWLDAHPDVAATVSPGPPPPGA